MKLVDLKVTDLLRARKAHLSRKVVKNAWSKNCLQFIIMNIFVNLYVTRNQQPCCQQLTPK